MNNQINDLADDAGFFIYDGRIFVPTTDEDITEVTRKFAELIVRECCSKLVEMGEGWHEFANNPPRGQEHNASGALFAAYRLKEDAVNEIKEHFGVEE
jgi:hypothetical protein